MYGRIPLPWGTIANNRRLQSTKLIVVGYGQLNSTTVLEFMHRAFMNMEHLGAGEGIFFSF